METEKTLVIEASRDHGKSWFFSYAYPLFRVQQASAQSSPVSIALISYSEEQAKKNVKRIRKAIESNQWLKWLVSKTDVDTWDSGMLNMSNGCTIESFGFGSSIRGGHFHHVIIDDPCKDHGGMSIAEQLDFLYGVIVPATRRGGQIIIVGNPVAQLDFLEALEHNTKFNLKKYPCWNAEREPLWPEQYTYQDLLDKKALVPAHDFAREYLLQRVSGENARFKEEMIVYYDDRQLDGKKLYKIMTIDPALSPGGDALGGVVTGTDEDMNTYVLDILGFRGDFRQGIELLCDMMERNQPQFVGCEKFAFQEMYRIWLDQEIQKRSLPYIVEALSADSRRKKAARIESLQPKLARRKLFFKHDHKPLIDQLLLWDPLSKTNDDDIVDALAHQVPLWDQPMGDDAPRHVAAEGSFEAALEERYGSQMSRNYLMKLFQDFRA